MYAAKFYRFYQNNSGGEREFSDTKGITKNVIIEALSPELANHEAEKIGIYFDGCLKGKDCDCCGDRWEIADETDVVDLDLFTDDCFVHYIDGSFKRQPENTI